MKRLTEKDEQGNWCLKGIRWEQLGVGKKIIREVWEKLYGALWKLMEYETTGMTPEEMDRYLYKAKRIDTGEWVDGNLVVNELDTREYFIGYIFGVADGKPHDLDVCRVDPSTICQCTGLKDKNGRLIWENDIVAYWDSYSTENGQAEADCIGEVVWDDETISFQVTNRLSAESYEVLDECYVSGNTFDNPELLGSEG